MKEITGDIWDYYKQGYWIVITTNGTVKKNGEAVMGKGIALQARLRFPELPRRLGRLLDIYGNIPNIFRDLRVISFPTKYHWASPADIDLIEEGCKKLVEGLKLLGLDRLYLTRLGCSNGRLDWKDVKPVLERYLDDRFIVVEKSRGGVSNESNLIGFEKVYKSSGCGGGYYANHAVKSGMDNSHLKLDCKACYENKTGCFAIITKKES